MSGFVIGGGGPLLLTVTTSGCGAKGERVLSTETLVGPGVGGAVGSAVGPLVGGLVGARVSPVRVGFNVGFLLGLLVGLGGVVVLRAVGRDVVGVWVGPLLGN